MQKMFKRDDVLAIESRLRALAEDGFFSEGRDPGEESSFLKGFTCALDIVSGRMNQLTSYNIGDLFRTTSEEEANAHWAAGRTILCVNEDGSFIIVTTKDPYRDNLPKAKEYIAFLRT